MSIYYLVVANLPRKRLLKANKQSAMFRINDNVDSHMDQSALKKLGLIKVLIFSPKWEQYLSHLEK